ncbi:hypothetical protein H1C71_014486 [Ictidomys tridecemlineatus]|nr:hypothetical protein H1C71_014486 [Ictidomys tridecemlineatus]
MGQSHSTPLSLTLDHWTDVHSRTQNLSFSVKRRTWQTLYVSEWPTLGVEWPPEGSFHLPLIRKVRDSVFQLGPRGHPDQQPYILTWPDLCEFPPMWIKPFLIPASVPISSPSILSLKSPAPPPCPFVLPESQDLTLLDSNPPPYPLPMLPNPQFAPSDPPAADSITPQLEPPPLEEAGPAKGTRRRRIMEHLEAPVMLPLRPYGPTIDDGHGGEMQAYQYWPFSSSDLYNWKDPTRLTGLVESLMFSHQPTWDDCQHLLGTLFTTEEPERILLEARKNILGPDGRPTQLPNIIEAGFPLNRSNWDPNTFEGREHLSTYRQALVAGLRAAARQPTNLAKVREIIQGPNESLSMIMEAYRRYTPFDPQAEDQKASVAMAFIGQAALDIKRKLQRLDGLQEMTLRDLVREAEKVYYKRETEEEKEQRREKEREHREDERNIRQTKTLAKVLVTATDRPEVGRQGDRKGYLGPCQRPPLASDQCAYCKEKGHWAKECPKRKQMRRPAMLTLIC